MTGAPEVTGDPLVVVGGGPAGVAAVLMAASVGLRTTLVEADRLGGKLHAIGALENVPGGWSEGPALADAMAADVERLRAAGRCTLVYDRAVRITGFDDRAEVALRGGRTLAAAAVVVATGVSALAPGDGGWADAPPDLRTPPLWRARAGELAAARHRPVVLGGDRPLGTWLRAHPDAAVEFEVVHPAADRYKIAEVADDPRVHCTEAEHVVLAHGSGGGIRVTAELDGGAATFETDVVLANIGSKPEALPGLARDRDGYCPPSAQHPRVLTAGDLRSARFQRIATAQGSGAEASLVHYYG